jgi:ABC-type nitrate/sulfonate/bicarbonate transport system permease component
MTPNILIGVLVGSIVGLVLGVLIPPPRWFCRAADWLFDRLGA